MLSLHIIRPNCDGKCGLGKYNGRTYTCPHNNLAIKYPDIAKTWDYEKNQDSPHDYLPGSNRYKWWKCDKNPCGCHKWEAPIYNRTKGSGCPYCNKGRPCLHNNFAIKYPDIAAEWDYENNNDTPDKYSGGSNVMKWWKCNKDPCGCHRWQALINLRTRGTGCPYCNNDILCPHNNLAVKKPEIASEWDYEKNQDNPENYFPSSRDIKWWICNKNPCGCHRWQTAIYHRNDTGCPYCEKSATCEHNNLAVLYPDIAAEWDYERNQDHPSSYRPRSNVIKWWICKKNSCGCHRWQTAISNRLKTGCPFCNSNKPCPHNNFAIHYPNIASEWNYEINEDTPDIYSYGSHVIRWWKCKQDNLHIWSASIKNRVLGKTGCPICKESHGENLCRQILIDNNLTFISEWDNMPYMINKRYDFYLPDKKVIIEYDGIQHFEDVTFFSKGNLEHFQMRRNTDIDKTKAALSNGFRIIRIDYIMSDYEVRTHIMQALKSTDNLYLSSPHMYEWLTLNL